MEKNLDFLSSRQIIIEAYCNTTLICPLRLLISQYVVFERPLRSEREGPWHQEQFQQWKENAVQKL